MISLKAGGFSGGMFGPYRKPKMESEVCSSTLFFTVVRMYQAQHHDT